MDFFYFCPNWFVILSFIPLFSCIFLHPIPLMVEKLFILFLPWSLSHLPSSGDLSGVNIQSAPPSLWGWDVDLVGSMLTCPPEGDICVITASGPHWPPRVSCPARFWGA